MKDPYSQTVDEFIEATAQNGGGIPRMLAQRILDLKKENEALKEELCELRGGKIEYEEEQK